MKRIGTGMAAGLALAALAAVCWMIARSPLVVGMDATRPPLASLGGESGAAVEGYEVEVARAIAAKLGKPLEIVNLPREALWPALATGRVDLVMAGMAIGDSVPGVEFSDPYYEAGPAMLVLAGGGVPGAKEELRGRKIGAVKGSKGAEVAMALAGKENVRLAATMKDGVVDLMNSKVEAAIVDEQAARQFIQINPELVQVGWDLGREAYGVAVRQGDGRRLGKVNEALAELKADGRQELLVQEWMVRMVDIRALPEESP